MYALAQQDPVKRRALVFGANFLGANRLAYGNRPMKRIARNIIRTQKTEVNPRADTAPESCPLSAVNRRAVLSRLAHLVPCLVLTTNIEGALSKG